MGSVAPKKRSKEVVNFIKRGMKNKFMASSRKIATQLKAKKGVDVSYKTIQRRAKQLHLRPRHRVRRPFVTPKQQKDQICKGPR
jgi:hypothetical protein